MKKKVITEGGGDNLFKIIGSKKLEVLKVNVGLITNTTTKIGTADTLENALVVIKSHTGKGIKSVQDW